MSGCSRYPEHALRGAGVSRIVPALFALFLHASSGQTPAWPPPGAGVGDTFFTDCTKASTRHAVSPLSFSDNGVWRAYIDVAGGGPECLMKTSLWIAPANGTYQLAYFMAPLREAGGDGMRILGWMPGAPIVLVMTERWQWGSDADATQQVLAIEAPTGRVYEPGLAAISQAHSGKRCRLRVEDAGFGSGMKPGILIRVRLSTDYDPDETENDVPPEKRCGDLKETWAFDYSSAYEVRKVSNQQPLLIYRSPGSMAGSSRLR